MTAIVRVPKGATSDGGAVAPVVLAIASCWAAGGGAAGRPSGGWCVERILHSGGVAQRAARAFPAGDDFVAHRLEFAPPDRQRVVPEQPQPTGDHDAVSRLAGHPGVLASCRSI